MKRGFLQHYQLFGNITKFADVPGPAIGGEQLPGFIGKTLKNAVILS